MLLAIYQNEKRPEGALGLLENLIARYPGSYLLKLETASTLVQLHRAAEAYKLFDDLLKVLFISFLSKNDFFGKRTSQVWMLSIKNYHSR